MRTEFKVIMAEYVSGLNAEFANRQRKQDYEYRLGQHLDHPQSNPKPSNPEPVSEGWYCGKSPREESLEKTLEALDHQGWEIVSCACWGAAASLVYTLKRLK